MEPQRSQWLGIDIGGANLKVSDSSGNAINEAFPLWQKRDSLCDTIQTLVGNHQAKFPNASWKNIALTMTGELADCYQTKAEGVADIIYATVSALSPTPIKIATVDDRWVTPSEASANPLSVAAANWRLTARLLAKHHFDAKEHTEAMFLDIGSTTADLIPLRYQQVISKGRTDTERLIHHELVYTGIRRTPVSALVEELPYRGNTCPIATEWFATTADVWLMLGKIEEEEQDCQTADGRPLTIPNAIDRLARCLCADRSEFTHDDALHAAQTIATAQAKRIAKAIRAQVPSGNHVYYVAGEGEFLARRVIESLDQAAEVISLSDKIGLVASQCGPAYAAAFLAEHECEGKP